MTFAELKTEIKDRLSYTSTDSDTRVGRLINKIYREITTTVGLDVSRNSATSVAVTIGNAAVTFTGAEKVLSVWILDSSTRPTILEEVLYAELSDLVIVDSDKPRKWAVKSTASNSVTIKLDAQPETAYTLYADIFGEIADLSSSNEPAFPESFHDIIIEGVLKEEYQRLEKPALSDRSEARFQRRLSDLRMFIAKSNFREVYQGKNSTSKKSTGASGGGSSFGATALNITGLWTFARGSALAPFAISNTDALYVTNLGAEF